MTWQETLRGRLRADWADEIDVYERQLQLRKQGKMEERLFAETRLRRGAYGQRYDNGQRHDGIDTRKLAYPNAALTKGPETLWDAPGMHRIKIPFGAMTAEQMDVLAALSEEYSDAICHVTTRQDIQLHFVHIDDTPDLMRRLAAVGITTREACGNSVRNVTACPLAGVCQDEAFDVSPYAKAATFFLLGHADTQNFGRKFKIAFSGCAQHACGLTTIHDLGLIAQTRDGQRGFQMVVGGGLGAVPYQAQVLYDFLPEAELLPVSQAVCRVFGRLGEKTNRARARIKFLVAKLGIEEFKRLVELERTQLRSDARWGDFVDEAHAFSETPLRPAQAQAASGDPEFARFLASNTLPQRQAGYRVVTVKLPLGDATADQMRSLAQLAREFTRETVRTTVEQNLVFRWIAEQDLPALYQRLLAIGLGESGANSISDVTACPGTDTCKLGISASRGLAAELHERLHAASESLPPEVRGLRIKASGCFNSCGQHHIADMGFLGVGRKVGRHRMPHFQLVIGGQWSENGASYGLAVGAIPSKRVPEATELVTAAFMRERSQGESFQGWVARVGKGHIRDLLKKLMELPTFEQDPSMYSDWGDPRLYTTGDMGVGECAGEVIPFVQFGLSASERICFDAQLRLDAGEYRQAATLAYHSMLEAAKALTRERDPNLSDDSDEIVSKFRELLVDTQLFRDPFMGDKFARFLFHAHGQAQGDTDFNAEQSRQRVQEAQHFIEAAHACVERMDQANAAAVAQAQAQASPSKGIPLITRTK